MANANEKITKEEVKDEAIEVAEQNGGIINIPAVKLDSRKIQEEIEQLEKNIKLFNQIKILSLKLTKEEDWIDQGGNPYLMDRGAENIAIAWGVDITDVQVKQEWYEDAKGRYFGFIATGRAYSKKLNRTVEDVGVCTQRDKFFARMGGKLIPVEEVDVANIRRKAVTNLHNRLIKRLVGLMSVTFDDLKKAGLNVSKIQKIEYRSGKKKTERTLSLQALELREKTWKMLMDLALGDEAQALTLLEEYSKVTTTKNGKERTYYAKSPEDLKSEKWIQVTYGKVKEAWEAEVGTEPEEEQGQPLFEEGAQ